MNSLDVSWEKSNQILCEAASACLELQVTVKLARQWQNRSTRFTRRFEAGRHLVVRNPFPADCPIKPGQLLGCSFRKGQRKFMFTSAVLACEQLEAPELTIAWPDNLQQMQRRFFARAAVPPDMHIPVKIWPAVIALTCACPDDPPLATARLVDISAGGGLIKMPKDSYQLDLDMALLIEMQLPDSDQPVCVEACVRRKADVLTEGRVIYGLQFVGLDQTPAGRQTLQRLGRFALKLRNAQQPAEQES